MWWGVVDSYALSCFHEDVRLGDFPAIRHIKRADAVIENCDPLCSNAVSILLGMIHFNVVDQLRHHVLCDLLDVGVPPDAFKEQVCLSAPQLTNVYLQDTLKEFGAFSGVMIGGILRTKFPAQSIILFAWLCRRHCRVLLMCNIVEKLDEEAEATATANDDWHQLIGHSATAV